MAKGEDGRIAVLGSRAMGLADLALSGLTPFNATLEGDWLPERATATYRQREWRGVLRADRAFVAVSLACHDNALSWCRTRWPAAAEREVRVTCSSYGPKRQYFSVYLSIADAIVQTAIEMATADACVVEIASGAVRGGAIELLARLPERTHVFSGAWLIDASNARSARNHTWHLRSPHAENCDPRAARIFGGRRNGAMTL